MAFRRCQNITMYNCDCFEDEKEREKDSGGERERKREEGGGRNVSNGMMHENNRSTEMKTVGIKLDWNGWNTREWE